MAERPHLFLKNPSGKTNYFNASRKIEPSSIPEKAPGAYRPQKNKLSRCLDNFNNKQLARIKDRTLKIPVHLEYIELHFLIIFSDNKPFQTKSKFKKFGLSPVFQKNFNQSIVFAITDSKKFSHFIKILTDFIESPDTISPKSTKYSLATIIYDFEFLSSDKILTYFSEDVIISLLNKNTEIKNEYESIYSSLIGYLNQLKDEGEISDFTTDEHSSIGIKNISSEYVTVLAKNFDIIYKIQSLRTPTIREDEFNIPHLTWALTANPPIKNVIIGILDNGVRKIAPLQNIIIDSNLDITNVSNPDPTNAIRPHGTVVASLAALGTALFDTTINNIVADAYILPIKILNFDDGSFNIFDIEKVIKAAIKKGVKIFNLSVCGPSIFYNSAVSEYAYLLDKLTYHNDILIFIAAGNLDDSDISAMTENGEDTQLHKYPFHFYNPNDFSEYHSCECTNICIPGESYNNITVGAIAENHNIDSLPHLTPFKDLPAYYTRKHYINVLARINGTKFKESQKNKNLNKPDIVMPGGDRSNSKSGMQVLGFGTNGDFYNLDSGTSLSSPLAANIAAKIIGKYDNLDMQSVKALILNSANQLGDSSVLNDLEEKIKEEESQSNYGLSFSKLDKKQKKTINSLFSADSIYKTLTGHGTPIIDKALYSDNKSVTVLVQDVIAVRTYKVININIPEYLLEYSKDSHILTLDATLCYKFFPVWGNQLAYNPIHISFNFVNSETKDDPERTSAFLSNNKHEYFNQFYEEGMTDIERTTARNKALGIKSKVDSWSEDFFPPANKPFSNVQKLSLNINKNEISKVGKQISLVIRCTNKPDLDSEILNYLIDGDHQFSIAIRISEKQNDELSDFNLYDQLIAYNNLEVVGDLDLNGEVSLDLDA